MLRPGGWPRRCRSISRAPPTRRTCRSPPPTGGSTWPDERGDRARSALQGRENFRFFGAPHFALITTERDLGTYGAIDCGGYVSVFLLAAQSLGLAAIPQAAVAAYSPWLRDYFGLPDNRLVVCGISFGYPDQAHPANGFRTNRAPITEVVDWRD